MDLKGTKENENRYSIQAIEKALDVIEALAEYKSLNLLELAKIVNQPKSSLFRTVLTFEKRGYISRSEENGKYCLGYKQLMITKSLLESNSLRSCAFKEMKWLAEKYGDTVNLGVLSEMVIMYMEIIEGTNSLRMNETVGSTVPFHITAIGKAIVAHLPEIEKIELVEKSELVKVTSRSIAEKKLLLKALAKVKTQGYALDDEEAVQGARCIAAPIFNISGKVEGAISISGAIHRFSDEKIPDIAEDILMAANRVSKKLGYFM